MSTPPQAKRSVHESDIPFYKNQERIVFGSNIKIDPKSIDDYLAIGGYAALGQGPFPDDPRAGA